MLNGAAADEIYNPTETQKLLAAFKLLNKPIPSFISYNSSSPSKKFDTKTTKILVVVYLY